MAADPSPLGPLVVPFALGVHVTAALALLALDARARRIRWFVGFQAALVAWLALAAAQQVGLDAAWAGVARGVVSHLLPLAFLAFALVVRFDLPDGRALGVLAAGLLLLPLTARASPWYLAWVEGLHQAGLWVGSGVLVASARLAVADRAPGAARRTRARRLVRLLLAALPLVVTAAVLVDGGRGSTAVAALASTVAQGLVLVGAMRLQLYGVTLRVERAGELARDAAELERLALLGELGATVAHEVRNPLTGIRSLAQRLADGEVTDPARRARFGRLIVDEVDRLDRFVGSMLALARADGAAHPVADGADGATTSVATLLEDVQALVATRAGRRGVRLVLRAAAPAHPVARGPLAQVLLNLVLNAIEHSPSGGTVTLLAHPVADGLELVVRDEGPGIPAAARDTLFTAFAPGARGTGLGLAVARRVADARGWRLSADPSPSRGAVLRVYLPPP